MLGTLTALLNNAENTVVLDCGCGEGSMIKRLAANNNFTGIAADISKEAIALAAAGAYSGILWLVADAAALPLADESVDVILNILAPSNYSEFNRVLKRGGIIAKVIPGVNHLRELRERLSLTEYDNHDTAVLFKENLGSADETEISPPPFAVDDEMLRHVFNMTPMTENSDFDDVRGISAVSSNFKVLIYKKPARYEANDKN